MREAHWRKNDMLTNQVRHGLALTAALALLNAGAALAIGPGETALAARDAYGSLKGEVRVLTTQSSHITNWFTCPGSSTAYYIGSYELGEVRKWQGMGLSVRVEYMDGGGNRQTLCNVDPW
jgi:hypothetical protein